MRNNNNNECALVDSAALVLLLRSVRPRRSHVITVINVAGAISVVTANEIVAGPQLWELRLVVNLAHQYYLAIASYTCIVSRRSQICAKVTIMKRQKEWYIELTCKTVSPRKIISFLNSSTIRS